jgi:hypothetical protein
MLSTAKFHSFMRSTTFILVVSPSEVILDLSACGQPTGLFIRYGLQHDFNSKSHQLQSLINFRDLQILFWQFLRPRSFRTCRPPTVLLARYGPQDYFNTKSYQLRSRVTFRVKITHFTAARIRIRGLPSRVASFTTAPRAHMCI